MSTSDDTVIEASNPEETERRTRQMTEKGAQFHMEQKSDYVHKLEQQWHHVESFMERVELTNEKEAMTRLEQALSKCYERYIILTQ